jgi:hypothetical protein
MRYFLFVILMASLVQTAVFVERARADEPFPKFESVVIDSNIGQVCYAVTLADVDGDGKTDIVALSEDSLYWYQNPSWQRRVIIQNQTPRDNVCVEPYDIDGDGKIDFVIGAGWTSAGSIHWVNRRELLDQPWNVHFIADLRWTHRMRFADVMGKGKPQLVVSPLNAVTGPGVHLTALEIPARPERDRWPATVMNYQLNRMHNHWHVDSAANGTIRTLTASREGIHEIQYSDQAWQTRHLHSGTEGSERDTSGAGEIKSGHLADGKPFLVTVEPMHGTMLVVYLPQETPEGSWQRIVIDEGFQRGHAIWTADMDGDGGDEIIFGHSDTPQRFGVNVYKASSERGDQWTAHVVDAGGMATEDLVVADLNGDGRPDIVAGGRATRNVKLYINKP